MTQQESEGDQATEVEEILRGPDEDTFRIMLSTDNHLGYEERDNIRGKRRE